MLAYAEAEIHRADFRLARCTLSHNAGLVSIFDRQVGGLHQQSADYFLDVEFASHSRLRMEAHDAAVLFLAQEIEHLGREVRTDQNLGEKFINGAGEFQVPWTVGNNDSAEWRIRVRGQSFMPGGGQR